MKLSQKYLRMIRISILNKDSPIPSPVFIRPPDGSKKLVSTPVLGGLYHTYSYKKVA
ncbi:hypothetical protein [Leptospira interrogans]|uniref:hypothetical protein n=1 Tax=Leptospira interrogans TaxID=173 RepID=UPI0013E95677|nr:hypothetical protein [Leptospira interrogans]